MNPIFSYEVIYIMLLAVVQPDDFLNFLWFHICSAWFVDM